MIEQTGSFGNRRFFVSQLTAVSYLDGRFFFLIRARRPRKKSQAETNRGTTNKDLGTAGWRSTDSPTGWVRGAVWHPEAQRGPCPTSHSKTTSKTLAQCFFYYFLFKISLENPLPPLFAVRKFYPLSLLDLSYFTSLSIELVDDSAFHC